jgi:hypothetical protein
MATPRKTDRRFGEVIGRLMPGELLDTNAVREATGIGEVKLLELRREGRLRPHKFGNRHWYRAEDLIALIMDSES